MFCRLSCFSTIRCPEKVCQRPYCPFKHGENIKNDQLVQPSDPLPLSSNSYENSYGQISQPASTDYSGYYNDPYAPTTSSYAPTAPAYDPYNPFLTKFNYSTPSYDAYAPTSKTTPYSAYAPVSYTNEPTLAGGFDVNDDAEPPKRLTDSPEPKPKISRRSSAESRNASSKPVVPPEIGDDEILKNVSSSRDAASKKARRKPTEIKPQPSTSVPASNTKTLNGYVKKVTEIDRELAILAKERKDISTKALTPKLSIDVDALFDVEPDEPVPKKVCQRTSSSRDSASSHKLKVETPMPIKSSSSTSKPSNDKLMLSPMKAAPATTSFSDDDIQIVFEKPGITSKRVAHTPAPNIKVPLPTQLRKRNLLKDQLEARQKAVEAAAKAKPAAPETPASSSFFKNQRRIAHVPENNSASKIGTSRPAFLPKTTITKHAAKPQITASTTRCNPIEPSNRKINLSVRQKVLDKLLHEFKIFMPKEEAIKAAEREEFELLKRCQAQKGYITSVTGVLHRVREMAKNGEKNSSKSSISHNMVMTGKHAGAITVGLKRHTKKNSQRVDEFSEAELYDALFDKYLLTDEQLTTNGYPLWRSEVTKSDVVIRISELDKDRVPYVETGDPRRRCCRCAQEFRVPLDPDEHPEKVDCVFHWGKFWKKRVQGSIVAQFTCCNTGEDSTGCCYSPLHVTQQIPKSMFTEFVETPPPRGTNDPRSMKVFALDCEMVYTNFGTAVARLSVVDYKGILILDEIIKPPGVLYDSNYRFSGLTSEDVAKAKLDLAGAQQRFFEIVNSNSILIGHSLESDLKAMRLVHKNVVDTSVLFPHRMGPPLKRALKNLSSEILMELIQENTEGHDSSEDARIALRLVLHKLKTD